MKQSTLRLFLFLAIGMSWLGAAAQFTYVEGSFGYSAVTFKPEDKLYQISARSFTLNLSGIRRIARPIGFGLELGIPISQSGLAIDGSLSDFTRPDVDYQIIIAQPFREAEVNYSVRQNLFPRVLMRIYLGDGYSDFYFEGRFGFSSITEQFSLERDAFTLEDGTQISAVDIDYDERAKFTAMGFGMGYQNTYDSFWYFRTRAGFDVLNMKPNDFDISLDYGVSEEGINTIDLDTYIQSTEVYWHIDMGVGYYF